MKKVYILRDIKIQKSLLSRMHSSTSALLSLYYFSRDFFEIMVFVLFQRDIFEPFVLYPSSKLYLATYDDARLLPSTFYIAI